LHPADVLLASAATELRVETDVLDAMTQPLSVRRDVLQGSEFTWSYDLMLIQKEHGHPCGRDELVYLRPTRAERSLRVPINRGLPDPVRLVQDQDVQRVVLRLHELVEILEEALHTARALAGHLPQRLCERT
jgi:hypothetical protein